jgi:hypothetical protein
MLVAPAEQVSRAEHSLPNATDRALPLHAYTGHAGGVAAFLWWAVASQSDHEIAEFVP